uniref:Band 7 domain-containing protein n=1 Tax=Romanomermis culicivorax TaxID=13658 RepID=A0A915IPX1_ROMCU
MEEYESKVPLSKKISTWRHTPYRNSQQYQQPLKGETLLLQLSLIVLSIFLVTIFFPVSLFFCLKVANEYERVVIFRLGKLKKGGPRGPGLYFVLPCVDECRKVDLRVITYDIPPQEILSKDSVTIIVDCVVYVRISDPIASVVNASDAFYSTKLLTQTTLRNVLGIKTLSEMLSDREGIAALTETALDEGTEPWGVKVRTLI